MLWGLSHKSKARGQGHRLSPSCPAKEKKASIHFGAQPSDLSLQHGPEVRHTAKTDIVGADEEGFTSIEIVVRVQLDHPAINQQFLGLPDNRLCIPRLSN